MVTVRCSGHIIIINCVVVVPHRCTKHKLRPIATYVAWSVCLSVRSRCKRLRELCARRCGISLNDCDRWLFLLSLLLLLFME